MDNKNNSNGHFLYKKDQFFQIYPKEMNLWSTNDKDDFIIFMKDLREKNTEELFGSKHKCLFWKFDSNTSKIIVDEENEMVTDIYEQIVSICNWLHDHNMTIQGEFQYRISESNTFLLQQTLLVKIFHK